MADPGRLDELKRKFDENPRRYFAPLANEYRKNGEFERAIELCRAYLPHQPGHMSGYIVYGQALFDAGRGHEAAEIFQQALQLDPENIIALRHLGDIARIEGDKALAMQWYGRVLELDPKNEEITQYITGLASPGEAVRTPEGPERPVPPTIRPEPTHVEDAVALEDLMSQPDEPQPTFEATGWSGVQAAQEERDSVWAPKHVVEPTEEVEPQGIEQMFEIVASGESAIEPSITEFLNDRSAVEIGSSDLTFEYVPPEPDVLPPMLESDVVADLQEMEHQLHVKMGTEGEALGVAAAQPEYEREPEPEEPLDIGTPFITETMAMLYLQQGFTAEALDVYRKLAAMRDEPRLHDKVRELEAQLAAAPAGTTALGDAISSDPVLSGTAASVSTDASLPPRGGQTVREFFARIGARKPDARNVVHAAAAVPADAAPTPALQSDTVSRADQPSQSSGLGALFQSAPLDERDVRAAEALSGAFTTRR
jgi:tetratricopeptide (TPR) repeat protein